MSLAPWFVLYLLIFFSLFSFSFCPCIVFLTSVSTFLKVIFSSLSGIYISDYYFSLEKEMATHCSILAWRIPWTEKPGGLQSMGLQRVRHDWVTNTNTLLPFFRVSIWRFISSLFWGNILAWLLIFLDFLCCCLHIRQSRCLSQSSWTGLLQEKTTTYQHG